jgi:hypothetical protein
MLPGDRNGQTLEAQMKWLWVGLLLTIAVPAHADVLPSPEAARELADKVMDAMSKGDADHGFALMKSYSGLAGIDIDAIANKYKELVATQRRYGNSIGFEFLTNEAIGSSLLKITELHRFERHGMEWIFIFYKGASGWTINYFSYTDKLQDMFRH